METSVVEAPTLALITREEAALIVSPIVAGAQELILASQEDRDFACALLTEIADRKKYFDGRHDPNIKKWHEGHKGAVADKKVDVDPLSIAEKLVKGKIIEYDEAEERKRIQREQEKQKREKELADAEALRQAEELQAQGEAELANQVIEEAASAPAPVVVEQSTVQKFSGVSARETWDVRVVDQTKVPRQFIIETVDLKALKALANSQKKMFRVAGVEAFPVKNIAVKSSR